MELAKTLLRLWAFRAWLAVGACVALAAALASLTLMHPKVYATASTQMIVDAPRSALGDAQEDLTPYTARAFVFARLMTTPQALQYIGRSAGLPGNLIAASGPTELTGPQATHAPTAAQGITLTTPGVHYTLNFLQNPQLPTVDVYSEAPTTQQAIALANGAVSGFSAYIKALDNQSAVPANRQVAIRQLGSATGGIVDPGASKSMAAIVFLVVLALWCAGVLRVTSLRGQLRRVREELDAPAGAPTRAGAHVASPFHGVAVPVNETVPSTVDEDPSAHDLAAADGLPPSLGDDVADYEPVALLSSNGTGDDTASRRRIWARPGS